MARQGDIYLGGVEGSPTSGQVYNSGVGFSLTAPSPFSDVYSFEDGRWEVEVRKGQFTVVARSLEVLPPDDILNQGYEACQKYLDQVSITKQKYIDIEDSDESYTLLFKEGERWVLRRVSITKLGIEVSLSTKVFRDGKEVFPPPESGIKWIPASRYYRLSRTSQDIYEAYRYLFLSFESLISEIIPQKSHGEGENAWLRRALTEINTKIPLANYVPAGTQDPVKYFKKLQYGTRCDLFHAKKDKSILPYADLNPKDLAAAYEQLLQLWQKIVAQYFNIPYSSGAFTFAGFKDLMDHMFENDPELLATDDPTPPSPSDIEVSPLKHPVTPFSHIIYENSAVPGRVFLIGSLEGEALRNVEMLHRFCSKSRGNMFSISYIKGGLFPVGVDKLEYYHCIRLKNNNLPE
jgi:hypothetical protein